MYEAHFNLSGKPFQLNPDPRFFFRSQGHKRALAYMRYGLQQEQGFIVVTGDVGTGKTMLVNNLFKEIEDQGVVAAKIVSTNVKDIDLLRLLAAEFDLPFEKATKANLLHELEGYFTACRNEGKRVLLVMDEAQNLPRSALEELRMLSNFDHEGVPLVQSFLLGQREFRGILRAPGLEQLRQRVIAAYHLKPLSAPEVKAYIEHRMHTVGWRDDPRIDDEVYQRIFEVTGGVPRRINTLFDRTLLNCFLEDSHHVTLTLLDNVYGEIEIEQGEDGIDVTPEGGDTGRRVGPVPVPAAVSGAEPVAAQVPAADTAAREEVARLEQRLAAMQQTIVDLNERLAAAQRAVPVAMAVPREPEGEAAFPLPGGARQFPLWTTAFLSLLVVVAVSLSIGYWLIARH